ncbi:MAG: hypothetical protein LBO71_06645 [Prevotellaceae bacterium]|jgi:hypothetical protein|nr:hypothetical protein [Prevotellaceae bacterium]
MNFYRTILLLLVLFSDKIGAAQTEHHLGVIGGKVLGPTYTLQHNRWNVTATGGWLTGFKGGYASVTGGYRVISLLRDFRYFGNESADFLYGKGISVDLGLGVFGLGYLAPTVTQRKLAREMDYTTPLGVQFTGKVYFNVSPNGSFGMHIGVPLLTNPTEVSIGYNAHNAALWKIWLYIYQISLQYKLGSTGK